MKFTLPLLATMAAAVLAQGVTESIAPSASPPASCNEKYDGKFQITAQPIKKRSAGIEKRQASGILTMTLKNGILVDTADRVGYIASNYQFQFDGPPQAGAIFTAGFSVCSNSSLALGGSAVWYQCLSGSFYNLYDRHWAAQCEPILLNIIPVDNSGSAVTSSATSAIPLSATTPQVSESTVASTGSAASGSSSGDSTLVTAVTNSTATASSASSSGSGATGTSGASATSTPASGASASKTSTAASASSTAAGAMAATPVAKIGALFAGALGAIALL